MVVYHHVEQLEASSVHTVDDLEGCVGHPEQHEHMQPRPISSHIKSMPYLQILGPYGHTHPILDFELAKKRNTHCSLTDSGLQDLNALLDRLQKLLLMLAHGGENGKKYSARMTQWRGTGELAGELAESRMHAWHVLRSCAVPAMETTECIWQWLGSPSEQTTEPDTTPEVLKITRQLQPLDTRDHQNVAAADQKHL